jgi:hypothetical protein
MATKAKAPRAEQHERGGRRLKEQPHRFAGLFLAPFAGLLTAWLIHVWTRGVDLHWYRFNWVRHASTAAPYVAVALLTAATIGLSVLAWHFAEHRKTPLRSTLAGSVGLLGVLFAVNVGTGPDYWWSFFFILAGWFVATTWSIVRLDVTRNDKQEEEKEDSTLEKLGLKGWRARKVTPIADDQGVPLATEIEFQHAPGDTVNQLQEAVPGMESMSASPAGLSRATPSERADRSTATILHRDPLKGKLVLPPTSAPGGCITEALVTGLYSTGAPVKSCIAGGQGFSPTSYMFMGMTRAGKTTTESQMLTEVESRRNAVILYLNWAKGMQDVRPVIPGIEVAIIADEENAGAIYRLAMKKVKRIMAYRQRQLALFGIQEWNPEQCWDTPAWRTVDGKRVQMERMPFLICHFGEADAILATDGGDATYLTSKGLSLGVSTGWSLQRADATKMPTGLRFNIGTVWCFGCGDDVSATFALSDPTIKAGAHPEYWKQSRPGYFYFEGLGVDESLRPVAARSFGVGPNDVNITDELLRRNLHFAPRMAKLDQGSANATADDPNGPSWWSQMAEKTDDLRNMLLQGASANRVAESATASATADTDEDADESAIDREMEEEVLATTEVDGVELYPADPDTGARGGPADAKAPLRTAGPADEFSWEDERPAARDRAAAIAALGRVFDELLADQGLRDPSDPSGNTVIVTASLIADRYPFRSRPFYVEVIAGMTGGSIPIPGDKTLTAAPDLGASKAKYRLGRSRAV